MSTCRRATQTFTVTQDSVLNNPADRHQRFPDGPFATAVAVRHALPTSRPAPPTRDPIQKPLHRAEGAAAARAREPVIEGVPSPRHDERDMRSARAFQGPREPAHLQAPHDLVATAVQE